ncbi:MAG: hypothetical protein IT467_08620 [Dokdonella sp.]|uniref:hypothetical protein n=1 Tax=Dokdonella sp. TaxID=2291710 RepID=UPI0025C2440D|nr:hypothetical protein [Dokdonella sp.]MBZ0224112.1 hypothetical protein [Dokdonella sp.]MCC7255979.1 hypothetical protein [Dokdonella sp.]
MSKPSSRTYNFLNTAARLPSHILSAFYLTAALAVTGTTLLALTYLPKVDHAAITTSAHARGLADGRAAVSAVTLPTVTVRASDGQAGNRHASASPALEHLRSAPINAAAALSRRAKASLAMPYYSFANPLRVAAEE